MKKLVLNKFESYELLKNGYVTITRNGFEIIVGLNYMFDNYYIKIINPYTEVVVKNSKYVKFTLLDKNKGDKL